MARVAIRHEASGLFLSFAPASSPSQPPRLILSPLPPSSPALEWQWERGEAGGGGGGGNLVNCLTNLAVSAAKVTPLSSSTPITILVGVERGGGGVGGALKLPELTFEFGAGGIITCSKMNAGIRPLKIPSKPSTPLTLVRVDLTDPHQKFSLHKWGGAGEAAAVEHHVYQQQQQQLMQNPHPNPLPQQQQQQQIPAVSHQPVTPVREGELGGGEATPMNIADPQQSREAIQRIIAILEKQKEILMAQVKEFYRKNDKVSALVPYKEHKTILHQLSILHREVELPSPCVPTYKYTVKRYNETRIHEDVPALAMQVTVSNALGLKNDGKHFVQVSLDFPSETPPPPLISPRVAGKDPVFDFSGSFPIERTKKFLRFCERKWILFDFCQVETKFLGLSSSSSVIGSARLPLADLGTRGGVGGTLTIFDERKKNTGILLKVEEEGERH